MLGGLTLPSPKERVLKKARSLSPLPPERVG